MQLSVVLPCYNEETNIEAAVRDVDAWRKRSGQEAQIIVVNDGSKDRSLEVLRKLEKEIPDMTIVDRPKNGGYGMAVRDGCDAATTEWIAYMDSDGQFKAQDLDLLLARSGGQQFVTGRRQKRADPFIRNVFGKILGAANYLVLGVWVRDVNCGMKLFRRDTWKRVRPSHNVEKLFNTEMFMNLKHEGITWETVDVPHYPRLSGTPSGGSRLIMRTLEELMELRRAKNARR